MQPSSIGSVEPTYDAHNDRVKGFCGSVIADPDAATTFIEEARRLRDANHASRLSVRFVTNYPLTATPRKRVQIDYEPARPSGIWAPQPEFYTEFYLNGFETHPIPLSGSGWDGFWVQYFGENKKERIEPENILRQEDSIIAESLRTAKQTDPTSKAGRNGYRIETARGVRSDQDVRNLTQLYNTVYQEYVFPLTEQNVAGLVQNPNSITVLARNGNDEIASVAVAEVMEIPTDRGLLRISEISDEATHPDHTRNGLNQACVHTATEELLKLYGDGVHLVYAENRAVSRGVNQQSANLGWIYAGRLNRPVRIKAASDIEVEGSYEDLNVWYNLLRK